MACVSFTTVACGILVNQSYLSTLVSVVNFTLLILVMCIPTCLCICVYLNVCVYRYISTCVHIYIYISQRVCMGVYLNVRLHVCISQRMFKSMYAWIEFRWFCEPYQGDIVWDKFSFAPVPISIVAFVQSNFFNRNLKQNIFRYCNYGPTPAFFVYFRSFNKSMTITVSIKSIEIDWKRDRLKER